MDPAVPKRKIESFLDQYHESNTRGSYKSGVNAFLSCIYNFTRTGGQRITPEDKARFEYLSDVYFLGDRNYEDDVIAFSNHCADHYSPTTGRLYLSIVKEFLSFNDVDFTRKQEKNIRNKTSGGGPISEEADLSKDLIRKILNACDIRLKALVLILITSGMRIGEIAKIHMSDIVISKDKTYAIITLRGVSRSRGTKLKNRHSRITFIGKEAVEALEQYYEKRLEYIETACDRSCNRWEVADIDDGRVFPVGIKALGEAFRGALKRAGVFVQDTETKRATIHYHMFRKFFITTLTYSGIPDKFVDFYSGHLGALDRAYQRQTKDKLLEVYLRGEPYLRIYDESAEEIAKTKEEIRETKNKFRDMQIDRLTDRATMDDLRRQMEERNRALELELFEMKRSQEATENFMKSFAEKK